MAAGRTPPPLLSFCSGVGDGWMLAEADLRPNSGGNALVTCRLFVACANLMWPLCGIVTNECYQQMLRKSTIQDSLLFFIRERH